MWFPLILLSTLIDLKLSHCDSIKLEIFRVIESSYSSVLLGLEERSNTNLTLCCELSSDDHSAYDDQISWGKATETFQFKNETDLELLAKKKSPKLFQLIQQSPEVNRAVKNFSPLMVEDQGTYFCASIKYMKFKVVHVVVQDAPKKSWIRHTFRSNAMSDNLYCNEKMFKCRGGNACINHHYVCDKRVDCSDGSDESSETCGDDPCADKLQCDDGRCIPRSWCCDRHLDSACNVTYKPSCCPDVRRRHETQQLEKDAAAAGAAPKLQQRTRYVIVSVFIIATGGGIALMVLLMSKILIYAKKSRQHSRIDRFQFDECAAAVPLRVRRPRVVDANTAAALDLLILSDDIVRDRPPSYADVVVMDAPPPYTSQDCLNSTAAAATTSN